MTDKKLEEWFDAHRHTYSELAGECGSVAELMLRLEVYGDRWTKWDWVMFLGYLDFTTSMEASSVWTAYGPNGAVSQLPNENRLIEDVFDTLDNGTALDGVLTNKTVVLNLISWIERGKSRRIHAVREYGMLRLLAHVFRKFPSLWSMNWMFVRHTGKNSAKARTHRLKHAMGSLASRPDRYFESKAYLEDFTYRYWGGDGAGKCCCEDSAP